MASEYPKVVPNVFETSDGKLHATEEAAVQRQEELDLYIPLDAALYEYRLKTRVGTNWGHGYCETKAGVKIDRTLLLRALGSQGLKIVNAGD